MFSNLLRPCLEIEGRYIYIYIYVLYMYIIRSIELDSIILADLWHCLAKRPTTNPYNQFYKPQHLEA